MALQALAFVSGGPKPERRGKPKGWRRWGTERRRSKMERLLATVTSRNRTFSVPLPTCTALIRHRVINLGSVVDVNPPSKQHQAHDQSRENNHND